MKKEIFWIVACILNVIFGVYYLSSGYKSYDRHIEVYNKILSRYDSIAKVNESLKEDRTILIQEQISLNSKIDSISSIRPKNIKHVNNEVSRLHNSTSAGKLAIIDSILQSRKGQR